MEKDKTISREYEDYYFGNEINIEPHIKSNTGKESDSRFFRIYFANYIDLKTGKRKIIRQDFNAIGEFGRQGHGYNLDTLKKEIGEFLGINKIHNMIVIGAGNLGQTLANYDGFAKVGFPIKGLFDINPKLIGMKINGIEIIDLDQLNSFIKDNNIDIGILCVRKHCVQQMTDILVDAGIKGIWNFSAIDIDVPDDVKVESVNFSNSLFTLSYLMNDKYTNQKS